MTGQQVYHLRHLLQGFEVRRTLTGLAQMTAAAIATGLFAYFGHKLLAHALGYSLIGQILSVGMAILGAGATYGAIILTAGIPEAIELARRLP
jgi:hypothetical protein